MIYIKKTFFFGLLIFTLFLLFAFVGNVPAQTGQLVIVAEVNDEIKAGTVQYLARTIRIAEQERADYILIKLDTPGGLVMATREIVDLILETEITTIVFVYREGGWAYSAGTFILMAADYAIVHPNASIGAAEPVILGAGEGASEKMVEAMASWMESLAEKQGRNTETAEKFVRENLTLTGREAKERGVIDNIAKDVNEIIFQQLGIIDVEFFTIKFTFIDRLFNFLSHPYLVSLFLTIGGLALIMAIRSGEFEITGIVGIIALLIGFWGMGFITFSFLGIGLLLLGLVLLLIEMFGEPGFGILGIIGTIAIVLGIFTFGAEPFFTPEFFDATTMIVIGAALSLCLFFVIMGKKVAKIFKSKAKTGAESLIGLEAEVVKELNPYGSAKIEQEIWSAKSVDNEPILKGEKVEIIKVEGNTLIIKSKAKSQKSKLQVKS